jgi:hypothetical protein
MAPSQEAAAPQAARTPEQVEAEWSAKQAALGRQYAAETKALREQVSALQASQSTAQQVVSGTQSEAEALKQQLAESQKQLQQREQEYTADLRATKYPNAAEALDPQVLATMDEAKLAGLEARLTPSRFAIDPSTPARTSSAPKNIEDKTLDELKADLARMGPAFAEEMRSNF